MATRSHCHTLVSCASCTVSSLTGYFCSRWSWWPRPVDPYEHGSPESEKWGGTSIWKPEQGWKWDCAAGAVGPRKGCELGLEPAVCTSSALLKGSQRQQYLLCLPGTTPLSSFRAKKLKLAWIPILKNHFKYLSLLMMIISYFVFFFSSFLTQIPFFLPSFLPSCLPSFPSSFLLSLCFLLIVTYIDNYL